MASRARSRCHGAPLVADSPIISFGVHIRSPAGQQEAVAGFKQLVDAHQGRVAGNDQRQTSPDTWRKPRWCFSSVPARVDRVWFSSTGLVFSRHTTTGRGHNSASDFEFSLKAYRVLNPTSTPQSPPLFLADQPLQAPIPASAASKIIVDVSPVKTPSAPITTPAASRQPAKRPVRPTAPP